MPAKIRRLFIAEKPELASAIVKAIGGGKKINGYYQCGNDLVTYCFGHLLSLCDPEDYNPKYKKWRMDDLPLFFFPWKYKPIEGKKEQLGVIRKLIDQCDVIVNAGDPDEEGQLLIDELLDFFGNTKPVKRVLINDLNDSLVKKAIANIKDNRDPVLVGMKLKALSRQVADQLFGYNLSRAFSLNASKNGFQGVLPVGRVFTPILGLVVLRDRLFESHQESFYYVLNAVFNFEQTSFTAKYQFKSTDPIDDKNRIIDLNFLQKIAEQCNDQPANVVDFNSSLKEKSPPLPYNLLKLQVDCNKKFGYRPDKVKEVTQRLREKYKLITYNRSDCQYLSDEHHNDGPELLAVIGQNSSIFSPVLRFCNPAIKSRAFNNKNVTAHHAIIPTKKTIDIDSHLSIDEKNVYLMIARAYIAQFMPNQEYRETNILIDCQSHLFKVMGRKVTRPGWNILYKNDKDTEDDELPTQQDLSCLENSKYGHCVSTSCDTLKTKPLPRYSLDTLLLDLTRISKYISDPDLKQLLIDRDSDKKGEHGGIGTPATRDVIINNLFEKAFLAENGKKIISTTLGRQYYDLLPEAVKTPDMTALWYLQQIKIANGDISIEDFLQDILSFISQQINDVKNGKINMILGQISCPECKKGFLIRRKNTANNSYWWGCNNYPDCKATFSDKNGKPIKKQKPKISTTYKCPECQSGLIRRKSKKGHFWGCSGFPRCNFTTFDKNQKPVFQ